MTTKLDLNKPYDYTYDTIEKLLVNKILTDKKYLGIITDMNKEFNPERWFTNKNVSIIMTLASKFFKAYGKIPNNNQVQMLIKKICETRQEYNVSDINSELMNIKSTEIDPNDVSIERNILKFIREKGCYYSVSDTITSINNGDVEPFLKKFEKIDKISFVDDEIGMNYFNKDDMDKHWEYIQNPERKISTGWSGLDFHTNGGFLKDGRMLALFVGQAGLGKSLFLTNIAINFLKQNRSVVVISLEMSENVYSTRFDSAISEDNVNKLKNTAETSRTKIENFYSKYPGANLIIKEYPPSSIRVADVENYLNKLVDKGIKIEAIVIDYLNLLLPNTKQDNMYQSMKLVAEELRALSYKFNAPVISATQANRSGINNSEINLENISESAGLGATADFVGLLYQTDEDREAGIINMRIGKNRFGPPGKVVPFNLNHSSLKLTDMTFNNTEVSQSEADMITANLSNISADFEDI